MERRSAKCLTSYDSLKCRHPRDCLVPLYLDVLDSILLEKFKDVLGYFVGGVGGGRARVDPNPDHNGTGSPPPILFVSDEASETNRDRKLPIFHQLTNLGTDSAPDVVERGAKDSTNGLGRLRRSGCSPSLVIPL